MDNKLKHLEFIQNVIARTSRQSFLIKGWAVTLAAAILALKSNVWVALLPVFALWVLDAMFLRTEKAYRSLYDQVRITPEESIDFCMDPKGYGKDVKEVIANKTLRLFYLSVMLIVIAIGLLSPLSQ